MQTIIHITDLHHTVSGRKHDDSLAFVPLAVQKLAEMKSSGELGVNPILVFTGDLVQMGGDNAGECEFDSFKSLVLDPIQKSLGLRSEHIVLCPGNHEIVKNAIKPENFLKLRLNPSLAEVEKDLKLKLPNFFNFIERNGYYSVTRHSPRNRHIKVGNTDIVVFNGLAGIYSVKGDHHDHGSAFLLPSEASSMLTEIPKNAVVCTHHPLEWYDETSRAGFEAALAKNQCRFICGHEHLPSFSAVEKDQGEYVKLIGGASGKGGFNASFSIVHLSENSNAIAIRSVDWVIGKSSFESTNVKDSICVPERSKSHFERTRAFIDSSENDLIRLNLREEQIDLFRTHVELGHNNFVSPPISWFPEGQASSISVSPDKIFDTDTKVTILCGDELSGKSTLLTHLSLTTNSEGGAFTIFIDVKEFESTNIFTAAKAALKKAGAKKNQIDFILASTETIVVLDNVVLNNATQVEKIQSFSSSCSAPKLVLGLAGGARYSPAMSPEMFSNCTYFWIDDITVPNAKDLVKSIYPQMGDKNVGVLVGKTFKAASNIGVDRSTYFLKPIIEQIHDRPTLEPLNRYLLQEKIISSALNRAYSQIDTGDFFDSALFNMFMGELAYFLWEKKAATLTELEFHEIVDTFQSRVGAPKEFFNFSTMRTFLLSASILRYFEDQLGFLVPGVEDFFLAKHIEDNPDFGNYVLSEKGLLELPVIAQLYVAAHPKDISTIEKIFGFIDILGKELVDLKEKIEAPARQAISSAKRKTLPENADEMLDELRFLRQGATGKEIVLSEAPSTIGTGYRTKYQPHEAAAIYIQLGASIISVTRTMDKDLRKTYFDRLKPLLEVSMTATLLLANHISDGGTIVVRGVKVKAEYLGILSDKEERFYIILREMLSANARTFGFWCGSRTFYEAMNELLEDETDPLIYLPMICQQVEADVSSAIAHSDKLAEKLKHPVLVEAAANHFVETMKLQSIEDKRVENKLIENVAMQKAVITPRGIKSKDGELKTKKLNAIANDLQQEIRQKIGISTTLGKRFK